MDLFLLEDIKSNKYDIFVSKSKDIVTGFDTAYDFALFCFTERNYYRHRTRVSVYMWLIHPIYIAFLLYKIAERYETLHNPSSFKENRSKAFI